MQRPPDREKQRLLRALLLRSHRIDFNHVERTIRPIGACLRPLERLSERVFASGAAAARMYLAKPVASWDHEYLRAAVRVNIATACCEVRDVRFPRGHCYYVLAQYELAAVHVVRPEIQIGSGRQHPPITTSHREGPNVATVKLTGPEGVSVDRRACIRTAQPSSSNDFLIVKLDIIDRTVERYDRGAVGKFTCRFVNKTGMEHEQKDCKHGKCLKAERREASVRGLTVPRAKDADYASEADDKKDAKKDLRYVKEAR
jgi:hypothetical protein